MTNDSLAGSPAQGAIQGYEAPMNKKQRLLRNTVIALHRAGATVEDLAAAAPASLGVRSRFVYRALGYTRLQNPATGQTEWIKPWQAP
mgnify:CR=1 FL=1